MTHKARMIRKYQVSFGMNRNEAEAYYNKIQSKDSKQSKVAAPKYHSNIVGRVTVPE